VTLNLDLGFLVGYLQNLSPDMRRGKGEEEIDIKKFKIK